MYAALGGLTDFSDLVDGIERGPAGVVVSDDRQQLAIGPAKAVKRTAPDKQGRADRGDRGDRDAVEGRGVRSSAMSGVSALDLYHMPFRIN